MSPWRHLPALAMPFTMAVLVPALILGDELSTSVAGLAVGVPLVAVGVALFAGTVRLFARHGKGTLAPWDPTSRLVVAGPYRRVRNPMISGVLFVLLGEAAIFGSTAVAAWAAVFLLVNAVYMPLVEEPGLRDRFGADYDRYAAAVPRWIPRVRPWG